MATKGSSTKIGALNRCAQCACGGYAEPESASLVNQCGHRTSQSVSQHDQ